MAEIAEIRDPDKEAEQVAERLDALEKLMLEAEKLRRRQLLISGCTILLMLLILSLFILGIITYFRTYPKRQLMQEVRQQNRLILSNPYQTGGFRKFDRRILRVFTAELQQEMLRKKAPLRQGIRTEIRMVNEYAGSGLRQRFQNLLYTRLTAETRKYLADRGIKPDSRQLRRLKQLNAELAAEISRMVFAEMIPSPAQLEQLNAECTRLKQTDAYRRLEGEPLSLVESRMLENLLECVIFQLNEGKGMEAASRRVQP